MADRWAGVILGIVAGFVYLAIGPDKAGTDSHYLFAQAFLEGRAWFFQAKGGKTKTLIGVGVKFRRPFGHPY